MQRLGLLDERRQTGGLGVSGATWPFAVPLVGTLSLVGVMGLLTVVLDLGGSSVGMALSLVVGLDSMRMTSSVGSKRRIVRQGLPAKGAILIAADDRSVGVHDFDLGEPEIRWPGPGTCGR